MNAIAITNAPTKAKKQRGRKQTNNSIRMSRAMYILRNVHGLELHEIADKYNKEKRRKEAGKTLSPAAVCARVKKFELQFPNEVAQILGTAPALQPTIEATTGELSEVRELVVA